jgi:hypothetical protein
MTGEKQCTKCEIPKPIVDFAKHKNMIGGRATWCKSCMSEYNAAHYAKNKESRKAQTGAYKLSTGGTVNRIIASAKSRAVKNGLAFNVEPIQIELMLHIGVCAKSGVPFNLERKRVTGFKPFAPALDRIDSQRGYEFDNVQLVCNMFNLGKSSFDEIDFIAMCVAVADRYRNDPAVVSRLIELRNAGL